MTNVPGAGFVDVPVLLTDRDRSDAVIMRVPNDATGNELVDAASDLRGHRVGLVHARTGRRLTEQTPVGDVGVIAGDELLVVGIGRTMEPTGVGADRPEGRVSLRVIEGPSTGLHIPVSRTVTLGRENVAGIHGVHGATTSRLHAEVEPSLAGGQIRDLGSSNGTWVNGERIQRPAILSAGDRVTVGETTAVVELDGLPERDLTQPHLEVMKSRLLFNRPPRIIEPAPDTRIVMGDAPERPAPRRFPIGAAIAPLVLGVALAILWNPLFAIFVALSPIMLAITHVDDRRSGRKQFDADSKEFHERIASLAVALRRRSEHAASYARRRAPSERQLVWWAQGLTPEVWSRRPVDADFAVVALADQISTDLLTVVPPSAGDPELIAAAHARMEDARLAVRVPVPVDLTETAVIGLCGDRPTSRALARSVVQQLATLRSPRDLQLVVLSSTGPGEDRWAWTRWLPHTQTPRGEQRIAMDEESIRREFAGLEDLVARREELLSGVVGGRRTMPLVIVVLDGELPISPRALSRMLEVAPSVGLSVVFVGEHRYDLPGETSVVVETTAGEGRLAEATITFPQSGQQIFGVTPRGSRLATAGQVARNLSPLVDVTAGGRAAELPRSVTIFEALGVDGSVLSQLSEEVTDRWQHDRGGLSATVGMDGRGTYAIDLRVDGPHALVAGTTGSGKSEFLQTLVVSMAMSHPPDRLNFILVDYKGGAAFARCTDLPHTVGSVTNLDERLAERALISLRAELRRRERILAAAGAKDLAALEALDPEAAPPSLVIVIDEFAALRNEVPSFVDGVVDVAQRGRSMGVHLVLATQKPAGVITPQIEANTNIRVALRVANESESRDVLGTGEAARIDRETPGRAIVRIGTDDGVPVQSAWGGAHRRTATRVPCSFRPFGAPEPSRLRSAEANTTDLDTAIQAISAAGRGQAEPFRPWLPELPPLVPGELVSGDLAEDTIAAPSQIPVGIADRPSLQRQEPWLLDLAFDGNALVFGAPGSGKTTLLRTVAAQAASRWSTDDIQLHAIDAASGGLQCLSQLPHLDEVVDGSDLQRVQLLLAVLGREVERRRIAMAALGVDSHSAWTMTDAASAPPISLLLVDGIDALWSSIETLDGGRLGGELVDLFGAGRSVGVHAVCAASQRAAVPGTLQATAGAKMVFRLTSKDEYGWFGLRAPEHSPPAGRMQLPGGPEVQVAVMCGSDGNGSAVDQAEAITKLGVELRSANDGAPALPLPTWPERVTAQSLPPVLSMARVPVGVDSFGDAASLDLQRHATTLVVGPPQSGRSSLLVGMVESLEALDVERMLISTRRGSPLRNLVGWDRRITTDVSDALADLIELAERRRSEDEPSPLVLVVDDADDFLEGVEADQLSHLVRIAQDSAIIILAAATTFLVGSSYASWVRMMRNMGPGIVLQPRGREDTEMFNAAFPRRGLGEQPPGRGVLVHRGEVRPVQFTCGAGT